MSAFQSVTLVNPSDSELLSEIRQFEQNAIPGHTLHETAVKNLKETTFDLNDPFPRLENHDLYLFGEFATPTSLIDGADLFISLHLVITFSHALMVIRTPNSDVFADETMKTAWHIVNTCESSQGEGRFIIDFLEVVVTDIENKILQVHRLIDNDLALITNSFDERTKNLDSGEVADLYISSTRYRVDVLGSKTTVEETTSILKNIAEDRIDLRDWKGVDREFFGRELELYVEDLHVRLRRLSALRSNLEATLKLMFDKFEKIDDQSQTRASHNMTAVASIMLLPSFVVGFFGQNFGVYDELEHHWGWAVSIGGIVVLTTLQVLYFRRKKWL